MKLMIRSLVVSGVLLAGSACSEPPSAREAPAPRTASKELGPKKEARVKPEEQPALAATAGEVPRTILDGPEKKKEPTESTPEASKAADTAPIVLPQHEEPIDYSRPLAAAEVKVKRFVLARDVKDREPVEESDRFAGDEKIFAFMELSNAEGEPYAFRVHWEPVSGPSSPYGVELHVKSSPRFRTWSWTAIPREPGQYRAVLRTLAGEEIASHEFTIEPPFGD